MLLVSNNWRTTLTLPNEFDQQKHSVGVLSQLAEEKELDCELRTLSADGIYQECELSVLVISCQGFEDSD